MRNRDLFFFNYWIKCQYVFLLLAGFWVCLHFVISHFLRASCNFASRLKHTGPKLAFLSQNSVKILVFFSDEISPVCSTFGVCLEFRVFVQQSRWSSYAGKTVHLTLWQYNELGSKWDDDETVLPMIGIHLLLCKRPKIGGWRNGTTARLWCEKLH